jgi:hydrogenase-4 component F
MIEILFIFPLFFSLLLFLVQSKWLNIIANLLYSILYLAVTFQLYLKPAQFTAYFQTDSTGALFMVILAVLYFCVSIYNISYLLHNKASKRSQTYYAVFFLLFVFSMTGVIFSTHLGLLWVFVEATTLTSSYLIFFSKSDASLEAAWKYIFICSIGISLAFVGIIFLSLGMGSLNTLFFTDLYRNAKLISPFWLKLSFVFILIGFGTKMGLAPVHAWLPDAHSEAPSPVSAMLSGTLLNAALLGIIRVFKLMNAAGQDAFAGTLLLVMGFLSLLVSAVFIIKIKNYKRMLAYSSIENMGIIAVALGLGGGAVFAAFLQIAAHSLAKVSLFLTSGNILHRFGTKNSEDVTGLLKSDRATGWFWILSFIGIAGIPPSPIFLSEFAIIKEMISKGPAVLTILFFFFITLIIAGMGSTIFKMSWGKVKEGLNTSGGITSYIPQALLLILLFSLGFGLPDAVYEFITKAAEGLG